MDRLVARRIIADKYRLERALAAGGMGSVWSAWNTQLDIPVAIKFMAPGLACSVELTARFEREARAAAQIRSPHVVQIFEHGVENGLPYIVMELLDGEDLGHRMRRVGRMSLEETAHVVTSVSKALRRAHAMGIVHRDLKPANIFLAQTDEDEEVIKVLDFGVVKSLAEAVESGVTKTGELIGTPHYMSPEQARSIRNVDHRSDLWSLGIIAYRALTATLPFPDDEGLDRLMRICSEPIPPPSFYASDLGPEVDGFFARALAIDPDERFQTAREMADAINALAGVPPMSSRSGSRPSWSALHDTTPAGGSPAYAAHAYVYTSAAEAEAAPDSPQAPGVVATRRARPLSLPPSPRLSFAPPRPASIPPPALTASGKTPASPLARPASVALDQPTRVSGSASVMPRPVHISVVDAREARPAETDCTHPGFAAPSVPPAGGAHDLPTPSLAGAHGAPRSRVVLGAVAATGLIVAALAAALFRHADPGQVEAHPARLSTSALASEPSPGALPPAALPPAAPAPAPSAAPTAAPTTAPTTSTTSTAASTATPAATAKPAAPPSTGKWRAPGKPVSGNKPAASATADSGRKEGGIGRRPTY